MYVIPYIFKCTGEVCKCMLINRTYVFAVYSRVHKQFMGYSATWWVVQCIGVHVAYDIHNVGLTLIQCNL